jgi:hypothetical protein
MNQGATRNNKIEQSEILRSLGEAGQTQFFSLASCLSSLVCFTKQTQYLHSQLKNKDCVQNKPKKLSKAKSAIAWAKEDKAKLVTATMKKRNEPKIQLGGTAKRSLTVDLSKQTQSCLWTLVSGLWSICAKQTQIPAFSIKNQTMSKKQSQIKPKKLSEAKSAEGGQTQITLDPGLLSLNCFDKTNPILSLDSRLSSLVSGLFCKTNPIWIAKLRNKILHDDYETLSSIAASASCV